MAPAVNLTELAIRLIQVVAKLAQLILLAHVAVQSAQKQMVENCRFYYKN